MFSGCLEHTYYITVLPDDRLQIVYEARGDRPDIEDGFDIFPDSIEWNINHSIEEKDDETVHIIHGSKIVENFSQLNQSIQWGSNPDDSVHVRRRFTIEKQIQLFGVSYVFHGQFASRRFDKTYGNIWDYIPQECRVLEDDETLAALPTDEIDLLEEKFSLGILQWNRIRYEKRFIRVWEILKSRVPDLPDTSNRTFSIGCTGWSDDLRCYMNELDIPDPNLVNLEWWSDLRPLFLGRLVDITGIEHADLIRRIANNLEKTYQISKDLEDDQYKVSISLPGRVVKSSGTKDEEGKPVWEVSGKDLMNKDAILMARTFELSIWRVAVAAVVMLILFRWLKRFFRRKSQTIA